MAKFCIGESVRFKASELLVSPGGYSFKIGTDGLVGRVTGSVETTGEETKYYVDVKLPRSLSASVSCILGISRSSDVTLKLSVLESQLQSEKRLKPMHSFLFSNFAFPMTKYKIEEYEKEPIDVSTNFANLLKKWEGERGDIIRSGMEVLDSLREFARTGNVHHADGLVPADGGDKKMSKSRCVKLLESYRAEREKVKKGRKFERCLRDSVVDEALERAIELLKGGAE